MRRVPKVRIIGGGLTGLAAAFEAHRLGAREIELFDGYDQLGGTAWPRLAQGLEASERPLRFGPPGDPVRDLFERVGVAFEEVENRRAAASPAGGGDVAYRSDFPGPALALRGPLAAPVLQGESLADRLRAYPEEIRAPLARYAQWRLGAAWLDQVHGLAAEALGMDRVYPVGTDAVALAALKRADPAADALYGLPAPLWGRLANLTASLPRDGARAFFHQARQALVRLGITVSSGRLVPPYEALEATAEVVVWAADPGPLFKPLGLQAPRPAPRQAVTYVFRMRHSGQAPLTVRNFTAEGVVAEAAFHEHRGQTVVAVECLAERGERELRRELTRLLAGVMPGAFSLGETMDIRVEPRWDTPSLEAVRRLAELRDQTERSQGARFVAPAWEDPRLSRRLTRLGQGLAAALQVEAGAAAA